MPHLACNNNKDRVVSRPLPQSQMLLGTFKLYVHKSNNNFYRYKSICYLYGLIKCKEKYIINASKIGRCAENGVS